MKNANGFSTDQKLNELFSLFGNPEQIVSDDGTPFHKNLESSVLHTAYGTYDLRRINYLLMVMLSGSCKRLSEHYDRKPETK